MFHKTRGWIISLPLLATMVVTAQPSFAQQRVRKWDFSSDALVGPIVGNSGTEINVSGKGTPLLDLSLTEVSVDVTAFQEVSQGSSPPSAADRHMLGTKSAHLPAPSYIDPLLNETESDVSFTNVVNSSDGSSDVVGLVAKSQQSATSSSSKYALSVRNFRVAFDKDPNNPNADAPDVAFTMPLPGSINKWPSIPRQAGDPGSPDPNGRGLQGTAVGRTSPIMANIITTDEKSFDINKGIVVKICRNSDGLYWNGSTFTNHRTPLRAAYNSTTGVWRYTGRMPPEVEDTYTLTAEAKDTRQRCTSTEIDVSIVLDFTPPYVYVQYPGSGATLFDYIPYLEALVYDEQGGSGIDAGRVYFRLYRNDRPVGSNRVWDGFSHTWVTDAVLMATPAGNSLWRYTSNLPQGTNLPATTYTVRIYGYDLVGNGSSRPLNFTVRKSSTMTTRSASPATISSGVASAGASTVRLVFTQALDEASAEDSTHYSVTVNGIVRTPSSLSYDAATNSVTLNFLPGDIPPATKVVVQVSNISDFHGDLLSGTWTGTAQP